MNDKKPKPKHCLSKLEAKEPMIAEQELESESRCVCQPVSMNKFADVRKRLD